MVFSFCFELFHADLLNGPGATCRGVIGLWLGDIPGGNMPWGNGAMVG